MTTTHNGAGRWGRLPTIMEKTGLSRSTIYRKMNFGEFPRSIKIGNGHAIAWNLDEVENYMAAQEATRDAEPTKH